MPAPFSKLQARFRMWKEKSSGPWFRLFLDFPHRAVKVAVFRFLCHSSSLSLGATPLSIQNASRLPKSKFFQVDGMPLRAKKDFLTRGYFLTKVRCRFTSLRTSHVTKSQACSWIAGIQSGLVSISQLGRNIGFGSPAAIISTLKKSAPSSPCSKIYSIGTKVDTFVLMKSLASNAHFRPQIE
jgi:hypothetical protein